MVKKQLVPNLRDKSKYFLHYKNLLSYVQLGVRLPRFIEPSQWLKPCIEFNTDKRKETVKIIKRFEIIASEKIYLS